MPCRLTASENKLLFYRIYYAIHPINKYLLKKFLKLSVAKHKAKRSIAKYFKREVLSFKGERLKTGGLYALIGDDEKWTKMRRFLHRMGALEDFFQFVSRKSKNSWKCTCLGFHSNEPLKNILNFFCTKKYYSLLFHRFSVELRELNNRGKRDHHRSRKFRSKSTR